MPIFADTAPDERGQLLAFLAGQRASLRALLAGLPDDRARATPTASALSLAALVKHAAAVERRWVGAAVAGRPEGLWPVPDPRAEWTLQPEDTVEHLCAELDAAGAQTEEVVRGVEDLGAPCPMPGAEQWTVRWVLLHLLEESARHCGHADLLREQLDGSTTQQLGA
ncbi:DinB family protein [uncultured Pseudokineococcus sp.]|uniref:DinB family protein n=1 Tax=uncultured Pseudokineococcus sp. TaxID=1642928 RepID=UPI002619AF42|nr:DinB family protein [uncultured Pseudokineococcus sp.]